MKMTKLTQIVTASLLMALPAGAVQNGVIQYANYTRKVVTVKQNSNFPTQCRDAVSRAVSTWNVQTSPFAYSYSKTSNTVSLENGNDNDLTLDYSFSVGSPTLAEIRYGSATTAGHADADMIFNANMMFYGTASGSNVGDFFCPTASGQSVPATKTDLETVVLHELGHAFGLDHFTATSCTMYSNLAPGVSRRSPCSGEVTVFNGIYK